VGVNIDELGRVLGLCALVYLAGAAFNYFQGFTMAGVTQRVMSGLRRDVEEKLSRLPLRYFDSHSHGDVLSRSPTTSTISLRPSSRPQPAHHLDSHHRGRHGMMFWISPLLALSAW